MAKEGYVVVQGARQNNLKNVSVEIPRDALVVFTGISGSGKSSLAFGTLYAEAQRRYLESVSPYARRLFNQMPIPEVDAIDGLPPAVALQQQRSSGSTRSTVGSVTTLSNLLRMLYSRAGNYPEGQELLYADAFSTNTPEGACPECHGLGKVYSVTEKSLVTDDSLTIRERAIAAWPKAWQGKNLRDILVTLGYDVDIPWKELPQEEKDWILFTEETPTVPVFRDRSPQEVQQALKNNEQPSYKGTYTSAKNYILHTYANSPSASMKKRVSEYMVGSTCPTCNGKRLRPESLSVTFAGYDIAEIAQLPLKQLNAIFKPYSEGSASALKKLAKTNQEKVLVTQRIAEDFVSRIEVLLDLGLGYLALDRNTPTLSPGEHQRLRLATQVRSNLFGVVYVLDEPSAGLHPADTAALLRTLAMLKNGGNSIFVVEHELDVVRQADWIVDVGPDAGEGGGRILYSGPPEGLKDCAASKTRAHLFNENPFQQTSRKKPQHWLKLEGVTRNNLNQLDAAFPIGALTSVTGVSGSGKSSLVSQALVELMKMHLGNPTSEENEESEELLQQETEQPLSGSIAAESEHLKRMVLVNQKPIGRTPRSNLATYTGLFDTVRKLFAKTDLAKSRKYKAGRFSFNVGKGRCPNCEGEGAVMVELLFLPSVYAPCPVCDGTRYNAETLEVTYNDKNIAEVLNMTVTEATDFFKAEARVHQPLQLLEDVGLGYLRLGQPATELSGGEAQRIKLAKELQRQNNGKTLYVLDEPTTGLHPTDVEKLQLQLNHLVEAGNTVVLVEHDMQVIAASDWVIDMGPGAGDEGGTIVIAGTPEEIAVSKTSKTASYLQEVLRG
ncbi:MULTISPECIES: excinuclease ABC subunit UvrA [Leeuwenhoekiella]|mgnify:FL=1|uniref:excinuclease ABC subunit UvrA n=1 Tax=Leeuwenhoekiella TaxID=283735 RepID=UPI000E934E36|nr:excinuclease ABC subunit UvrA [Leeuwenhoekiella blandensis]HBT09397.1 excinuclease ABC subunit A [Leeuwenhoekiella sp.]|tara:strand:+ start:3125 stop:5638 length:2514 start_codon:yes stop_codon:yes gene_type:complete